MVAPALASICHFVIGLFGGNPIDGQNNNSSICIELGQKKLVSMKDTYSSLALMEASHSIRAGDTQDSAIELDNSTGQHQPLNNEDLMVPEEDMYDEPISDQEMAFSDSGDTSDGHRNSGYSSSSSSDTSSTENPPPPYSRSTRYIQATLIRRRHLRAINSLLRVSPSVMRLACDLTSDNPAEDLRLYGNDDELEINIRIVRNLPVDSRDNNQIILPPPLQ